MNLIIGVVVIGIIIAGIAFFMASKSDSKNTAKEELQSTAKRESQSRTQEELQSTAKRESQSRIQGESQGTTQKESQNISIKEEASADMQAVKQKEQLYHYMTQELQNLFYVYNKEEWNQLKKLGEISQELYKEKNDIIEGLSTVTGRMVKEYFTCVDFREEEGKLVGYVNDIEKLKQVFLQFMMPFYPYYYKELSEGGLRYTALLHPNTLRLFQQLTGKKFRPGYRNRYTTGVRAFEWDKDRYKVYGKDGYAQAFGAAGGTIGTGSGAFAALLFVLVLFLLYRPTAKRRIAKDRSGSVDSYRQISRIFFFTVIPVIVSSGVYNINSVIDNGIMAHGMESLGRGKEFLALWGIYNNKYMLLVHVPLAMANSLSSSLIPSLSGAIARKDRKAAIEKTALAIRFAMLIAIPSAVGLTVLSAPVNNLLFRGGNNAEAIRMMMIGASAVIFLSLSTVTNAILQGLNRMNVPVRNALISLALHVIALYIMLMIFNMGIYSMVFASILFALFMCILNAIAIRNTLGYRQEMVKTFLLPAISAAFMGAAAYGVYRGVTLVIHSNVLGTLLAVLVAVAVYGVLLIKLHCIEEDEMYSMPMGRKLTRICRKLHLM